MAGESSQTDLHVVVHQPPLAVEEAELPPPQSAAEEPLESVAEDSFTPFPVEEKLKEAVLVTEKSTPLDPSCLEPPQHASITLTETDSAASESRTLVSAVETQPHESEIPRTLSKEAAESEVEKPIGKEKVPVALGSFKEESNNPSDLSHFHRRTLEEFKYNIREVLKLGLLSSDTPTAPEEVSIWGVPLLKDERSDVILLKFLRARDFKVQESFDMLKNTIRWRKEFNVDELVKEDLGDDLEKVVFMQGHDKSGHPVCYNVYGEFQNKELYLNTFSDEVKRMKFLRWRIQFLERSIRKLDFNPGGINTIFQVSDLKNSPGLGKRELHIATKQALQILQDNYPEFVSKQVFINVPWWYLAFYTMISPFLTERTKSKFVFSGPTKTAETLFKYILPEQVPTRYGGLHVDFCECNPEFTVDDPVTEITVKPMTKKTVEIIINEKCTLVWELRVVGWEVSYCAEYIPDTKRRYTVIIQKTRKIAPTDEPVLSDNFSVSDLGKILLTIDNPTAKKKKLLYRFKVAPYVD
ncbi:patellin-3-like [Dorcoceras hygrometricum]|uniref:Patellin-3-like n=1 Tax=Dorcoceras hygrometricum TaxID=472368 RepID=A0A2Z7BSF1_9LAMI|nr:patellin-3-like [Dorcoceras hygrometricum]